jgi:TonB family protein
MIQRQLVPRGAHLTPEAGDGPMRRPFTLLDERQLIPRNVQAGGPLETKTSIPAHMPLAVLTARQLVPRDTPNTPLDWASVHPDYPPLTILDQRITVPAGNPPLEMQPKGLVSLYDLPDVLPPDVITTGEINLMVEAVEHPKIEWHWVARTGSIAMHFLLLLLIVFQAKVLPYKPPSQDDIARQQLNFLYLPPDIRTLTGRPRPTPPPAPQPQIRVDPRYLRRLDSIDETAIQPKLGPRGPDQPTTPESQPQPAPAPAPAPAPKLQPAPQPRAPDLTARNTASQTPGRGLILPPTFSPGRALQESAQQAMGSGSASSQTFGDALPIGPTGGGGQGYLGGDLEMLTPTEGVDFTSYLARIVASVKRNWFSVMPESARLGDQGRVTLQFKIYRNGMVPDEDPGLMGSSGKEPLDRAAISSIRTSSPFPPLPPAFSGPYIELRFMFLYNIPPNLQ